MWLLAILTLPLDWIQTLFHAVAHVLLWLAIAYAIASRFHWMQRIWIAWAQRKLTQLANGAPVTIGTFQMDIFRGRVYITDIIIHTPQREEWEWDSPLVARIGQLEAHLNPCSWLDGWMAPPKIRDIYGLYVTDVQVFCEKRAHVFNFHLLDPSLELPDPQHIQLLLHERLSRSDFESSNHPGGSTTTHPDTNSNNGTTAASSTHGTSSSSSQHTGTSTTTSAAGGSLGDPSHLSGSATVGAQQPVDMDGKGTTTERSKSSIRAEHKANEIMEQVMGAVSSIGRAVVNKEHLGRALVEEQKDEFLLQLKQFQSSSVETIAIEGKQVLAELGKMVGQNVSTLKQQVFLKPPPKRANYIPPAIKEEFRFGRVVLREMCFFTKQIITLNNTSNNNRTTNSNNNSNSNHGASRDAEEGNPAFLSSSSSEPNNPNNNHKNGRYYHDVGDNAWSKPILIREVMVSAAELCPPMSAKDDAGDPAVGQSLEQTFDVVLKRTLAESAKTNTGRLLQSVFGQVPFKQRPRRDTPATTATNTATTADSNSNSHTATHNKHASSCSTPHQNNLSSHGSTATATSSSIMITASNSNSFGSLVSASDQPVSRQNTRVSRASNYY
eukprot:CAMPEP_0198286042 /NCGR_PEP_ID=MMETSP1449-20131203/5210_1 /TAXON_ID=420275 /ORGANISM="Attheya septentrionalis, Strain CCMP2084" /LENGTH=609 /DNA_ID=CAMNT_0043983661 /DNA_START=212 /DNA_END=2041 /DNA_ORIENTATION=-